MTKKTTPRSFSIPDNEFKIVEQVIEQYKGISNKKDKNKADKNKQKNKIGNLNKTELIRVGIQNLKGVSFNELQNTLKKIGRKHAGRPKKEKKESRTNSDVSNKFEFIELSNAQWEEIKPFFKDSNDEIRRKIDEILFYLRYKGRKQINGNALMSSSTRWRTLKKWKETDVWARICRIIINSKEGRKDEELSEILLRSFTDIRK